MAIEYEAVIGLEVHVQLLTRSKLFCGCSTAYEGQPPNTFVCPVCLGLPGVLPVLNEAAVRLALRTVLALGGTVARHSRFDRKNYFYPDLPKAYQISQYDRPIGTGGAIEVAVTDQVRRVGLFRIHLEEDAGKLIHEPGGRTLVDYNRAAVPLLEIVTRPDMRHPEEARVFLARLKSILEYIEVSDCNMEEGSLRCDANVSVRPAGSSELGTKTEVKNLNSLKFVVRALEYEIERQVKLLTSGGRVVQETRSYDANRGVTEGMRSKEEAHDYRYFPEPDLPAISVDEGLVGAVRRELPELPDARLERFVRQYGLSGYDAGVLTSSKALAGLFEEAVREHANPKAIANWVTTELLGRLNEQGMALSRCKVRPQALATLVRLIDEGTITGKSAKEVFDECFEAGEDPARIVAQRGLGQIKDRARIEEVAMRVIAANPGPVASYRGGKVKALGHLVGAVMKETRGKANPRMVHEVLREKLAP